MSRADELRASLAVAEAEETYLEAKTARQAGELSDKKWEAAKRTVILVRIKQRIADKRPGYKAFKLNDDGTVSHFKERTRKVKHRDEDGSMTGEIGRIIPEQTEIITEVVEEVLG